LRAFVGQEKSGSQNYMGERDAGGARRGEELHLERSALQPEELGFMILGSDRAGDYEKLVSPKNRVAPCCEKNGRALCSGGERKK